MSVHVYGATPPPKIEWTHEERHGELRQIAKCPKCKTVRTRMVGWTNKRSYRSDKFGPVTNVTRYTGEVPVECCGRQLHFKNVQGTYDPDKKCGAKCRNSTGPTCECSCAGKNHGAGYDH